MNAEKCAIIGSGLIGQSWAMIFAGAGYSVSIYDIDQKQVVSALNEIEKCLRCYEKKGCLRGVDCACVQSKRITGHSDLPECIRDAVYVQECVPESVDLKCKVFSQLDSLLSPTMVVASSSSCLGSSQFAGGMKHRDRVVVAHPVNPPYFVPLVEIVPSIWTAPDVIDKTCSIMKKIGQSPVTLSREVPGFALNRIQYAIINECWSMYKDGLLSAMDIDKVMKDGLGPRYVFMGPLETMHLNANGVVDYCEHYADGAYNVCKTLIPPPIQYDVQTARKVQEELEVNIPLSRIADRRRWRDDRLSALTTLKRQCDEADRGGN